MRADWSGTLTYNPAICANRDGGPVTWSIHMNGDKGGAGVWNGSSYSPLNFPSAGTKWHHLAITFDNETLTIYWDGAELGTRPQGTGTSPSTTQLASSSASFTDEGWVGMLDEVAFYADALPADAIQAHYQALFLGSPPVIIKQPHGGTYLPGVPLQLSVGATGPNLSYQWFKDGAALAGKVSATLPFGSLAVSNAGVYHVKVSNPAANVVSDDVTIAVVSPLPANLRLYQQAVTNEPSLISYYVFDQLSAADRMSLTDGTLKGTADFGNGVGGGPDQGLLLDGAGHVSLGSCAGF